MTKNNKVKFKEEHAEIFKDVFYIVEATFNEQFMLWELYNHYKVRPGVTSWQEVSQKKYPIIRYVDDRPVAVTVFYAIINKAKVAFYEGTSQLVDHQMIDEWLELHFKKKSDGRLNKTNISNFHHCLMAIKDHYIDLDILS